MIRNALQTWRGHDTEAALGEKTISYGELARQAAVLQACLPCDLAGSIAAVYLPDGSDFLAALFAVLQAGWAALPLSNRLKEKEVSDLVSRVPVKVVFTAKKLLSLCRKAVENCQDTPLLLCTEEILLSDIRPLTIEEIRKSNSSVGPDSTMLLLASSGTTGRAKLVCLSEANIDYNVHTYLNHMGYELHGDAHPRYVLGTPFSGIYGLLVAFSCITRGFPMLSMADDFTLDSFYRAVQDFKLSHYEGGTLAALLICRTLDHPSCYDISTLKYFGFGGSKAPAGTLEHLSEAFPQIRFWSGYGMTEASPLIAQPFQVLPFEKLESVGVPLPGAEIRLETEGGLTDEPDSPGEIVVRGPNVMRGYYEDEEATREIMRDGWLHTGDIGYFDKDGYLYICGRKKNMILVRGFNVYPEEVETCLISCPLVKDCVVYGTEDEEGLETVCADVVPAADKVSLDSIRAWCASYLADFKCPRRIQLVEGINKTVTGKNKIDPEEIRH